MHLIFTDLDGTLLDSTTYSHAAAMPALAVVSALGIPWVLVSSKTRAEIEAIRRTLHHTHPFIVENGGALFIPSGYFASPIPGTVQRNDYLVMEWGTSYEQLRQSLQTMRESLGIPLRGFGDMSVEEIAALTGLPRTDAALAKQREYDEPLVINTESLDPELVAAAAERGLSCVRGGRFWHLTGPNDKGQACRFLVDAYRRQRSAVVSLGLGDSPNDIPMLMAVDQPVLVQQVDGQYAKDVSLPGLIKAPGVGPAGWNWAVLKLVGRRSGPRHPQDAS